MIRHRLHRHFLPHFYVSPEAADATVGLERNLVHHRAHALSHSALSFYFFVLVFVTVSFYLVSLSAPRILGVVIFSADQVINLINEERTKNGLLALATNPFLAKAAQAKASDMFANNYWAHNSPAGRTPWNFITSAGYKYVFAGENLARDFNDPRSAVAAWMDSPSHRSNILDENFRETGVAVAGGKLTGREGILVVQMFGTSISGATLFSESQEAVVAGESLATPSASLQINAPVPEQMVSSDQTVSVLAGRQFSIAKGISLALVGFIFLLFLLEVAITLRREHVSLRPGVLAHLAILGFILFAVWYAVGGAIL